MVLVAWASGGQVVAGAELCEGRTLCVDRFELAMSLGFEVKSALNLRIYEACESLLSPAANPVQFS
jgi:hypothetical protein